MLQLMLTNAVQCFRDYVAGVEELNSYIYTFSLKRQKKCTIQQIPSHFVLVAEINYVKYNYWLNYQELINAKNTLARKNRMKRSPFCIRNTIN